MKRIALFTVIAVGVGLATRTAIQRGGPALRARCSEMCERMLSQMPEEFPPNRMMADLDIVKEQTTSILNLLEDRTLS